MKSKLYPYDLTISTNSFENGRRIDLDTYKKEAEENFVLNLDITLTNISKNGEEEIELNVTTCSQSFVAEAIDLELVDENEAVKFLGGKIIILNEFNLVKIEQYIVELILECLSKSERMFLLNLTRYFNLNDLEPNNYLSKYIVYGALDS